MKSTTIELDEGSSFHVKFGDGHGYSKLVEFLRRTCNYVHFVFMKKSITCTERLGTMITSCDIDMGELLEYEFKSNSDRIVVGLNVEAFKNMTKNIGRKCAITMYKNSCDQTLYIIRGKNTDDIGTIQMMDLSRYTIYKVPTFHEDSTPNCVSTSSDFSSKCIGIFSVKPSQVRILAYESGIRFYAIDTQDGTSRMCGFGNIPTIKRKIQDSGAVIKKSSSSKKVSLQIDIINSYSITPQALKAISRISTLCGTASIRMYASSESPLRISTKTGAFGTIDIFIKQEEK